MDLMTMVPPVLDITDEELQPIFFEEEDEGFLWTPCLR
jgi:hypothetical protein